MCGGQELPSLEEVLAGALRNPKERQRVLRLETELQNKMFKASPQCAPHATRHLFARGPSPASP